MPGVTPGKIDHHIDSPGIRAPLRLAICVDHPLREIDLPIVEHMISAKLFESLEFRRTAGAGDDLSPKHFTEDHAARAYPAAGSEDQDPISLLHGLVSDEHAMGRAVGDRERRCLLERHGVRHTQELLGGNTAILRHAAVEHFAHQPLLRMDGVDEDAVAWFPAAYAWSRLDNFPSHIKPDDHR